MNEGRYVRMKQVIHVVAAVIERNDQAILCALRSPSMSMPNMWEFPGGKIEKGEFPKAALIREIKEELDCTIEVGEQIEDVHYEYPSFIVNLLTYKAMIINGRPQAKQHRELRWLPPSQLSSLQWAPADIPTVEKISYNTN